MSIINYLNYTLEKVAVNNKERREEKKKKMRQNL